MPMSVFKPILQQLRKIPSLNSLSSVNVGYVQWDTQAVTGVLLPFLGAAPNLEDFIITFDSSITSISDKNHPLYSPDLIG